MLALLVSHRAKLGASTIVHPCTFMNALWALRPAKPLGVHFIRHPCLTRTVRVRPPSTKKSRAMPVCDNEMWRGGGVESCLLCWFRIVRNLGQALSCIHARPAQCEFAPQHQKKQGYACLGITLLFLVPMAGVEPARYCYQRILSPSRLPIPSHRLIIMCCKTALYNGNNDFTV